jgi:hypothetical protein
VQQKVDEPLVPAAFQPWHLAVFWVVLAALMLAEVTGFLAWAWMWAMTWLVLSLLIIAVHAWMLLQ